MRPESGTVCQTGIPASKGWEACDFSHMSVHEELYLVARCRK